MKLLPLETYQKVVLSLGIQARKLKAMDSEYCRKLGHAISEDVKVLVDNLKENGYIKDFDLP